MRIILFGVYFDMKMIWEFPKIVGTFWNVKDSRILGSTLGSCLFSRSYRVRRRHAAVELEQNPTVGASP